MNPKETAPAGRLEPIHVAATVAAGPGRRMVGRAGDHEIVMDVSQRHGGEGAGPTPPECLAMALGGCMVNICRIIAMQKGIALGELRVSIAGDIDPSRAMGIAADERAGFLGLSVEVETPPSVSESEKEAFRLELIERCPLCDTIGCPTPLRIVFVN